VRRQVGLDLQHYGRVAFSNTQPWWDSKHHVTLSSSDYPSDVTTEVLTAMPSIETTSESAMPSHPTTYAATKGPAGQTWPTSEELFGQTEIPSAVEGSHAPMADMTSQPT
jgi:hypothetical protein